MRFEEKMHVMKRQKPTKRGKFSFLLGICSQQLDAILNFSITEPSGISLNIKIVLTSKQLQVYSYIILIISNYFIRKEIALSFLPFLALSFLPFFKKALEILRKDVKTRVLR